MTHSVVTIHLSAEALRDDDLYNSVSITSSDFTELVAVVAILPFEMQGSQCSRHGTVWFYLWRISILRQRRSILTIARGKYVRIGENE